jgi:radical SAM superfamily enzyme YgiQ (UPF0313 family)
MMQVNTPYPSTAYLTGFLQSQNFTVDQFDIGLDVFTRLFSPNGLSRVSAVLKTKTKLCESSRFFLEALDDYQSTILPTLRFLRGQDPSLAVRISKRLLLPEGPRFLILEEHEHLLELFGTMGSMDQAKYLASLYLDDIIDVLRQDIDPYFEFSKYGESLAESQISFDPLLRGIKNKTLIDEMLAESVETIYQKFKPDVVGFSIPFPGNVLGSLKSAKMLKTMDPKIVTIAGGGFINTELREITDPRFFDYFDFAIFDDGELPLAVLLDHLQGKSSKDDLIRTAYVENGKVVSTLKSNSAAKNPAVSKINTPRPQNIEFKNHPGPTYRGLTLDQYTPMLEMPNPMHRMWSDHRWNKLILAHGCYWKKCTFCDVSLDYIARYEPARIQNLVDNMERLIAETGCSGFHFVDEAAPPAILKSLSEEIIKRKLKVSWWGNLRFDKQFTIELANLMADSGCIAVTGGLEVASPRILELIKKGTTVDQVARVAKNFADAKIFVHAYLMYGFPSQTTGETIDSLEVVRQLFYEGCIQSAHWHRFVATAHSPVGKNPESFGIEIQHEPVPKNGLFAKNALNFYDPTEIDNEMLGKGLRKALYNYMHQVGLDFDVREWFEDQVPKPKISKSFVKMAIASKNKELSTTVEKTKQRRASR